MEKKNNATIETTFRDIGVRAKKYIAPHILLENAYESNLVSDVSKVDYLEGNLGRTDLQPLLGLPTFVDDLYVYGYLEEKNCIFARGKMLCTTGEEGFAKNIVAKISSLLGDLVDNKYTNICIVHTVRIEASESTSTIRSTVDRIERETNYKTRNNWVEQHDGGIRGIFVAKLDVSEYSIEDLHKILPTFEKRLVAGGYGIYSIDYTRDFSGTLDREKLVDFLVEEQDFRLQGDYTIEEDQPTILDNTDSVGNHVCTWISKVDGYTTRTKIYNKIVSNFEAGEIREQFGGHLADYVDCPNEHLRKTFASADVQARGCTRIEVSLYAFSDRNPKTADEFVENVVRFVSPENNPLFVVQPATRQYKNLADAIDRCFVLADRPQGYIYVCWYAHTKTKRIAGVRVSPTENTLREEKLWRKAIEWTIGDFGFRNCPIFFLEILSTENDTIQLSNLRCYTKNKDTKTILASSRKPTQVRKTSLDPREYLPTTSTIEWTWRMKKTSDAIGIETSKYKFLTQKIILQLYSYQVPTMGRVLALKLWR